MIPPPLPHTAMEEKVFDDMVCDLFPCGPRGSDDTLEKDHLFSNAETLVLEGCASSILHASLELLNSQTIYGWSNASLNALLK